MKNLVNYLNDYVNENYDEDQIHSKKIKNKINITNEKYHKSYNKRNKKINEEKI